MNEIVTDGGDRIKTEETGRITDIFGSILLTDKDGIDRQIWIGNNLLGQFTATYSSDSIDASQQAVIERD